MLKLAATGAGLMVLGAIKFAAYLNRTPTLEDYLSFRCGPSEQALLTGSAGHALVNAAHCWGCYAMAIGAVLLLVTAVQAMAGQRTGAGRPS